MIRGGSGSTFDGQRRRPLTTGSNSAPRWASDVLVAAAVYNLVWGFLVIVMPDRLFTAVNMPPPYYISILQCVGMIVGVYGIGYFVASRDPFRHWPIVLVGLLGKVLGPIGFVMAVSRGELPLVFGWTIITNDLIWWVPFGAILYLAARSAQNHYASSFPEKLPLREALERTYTESGTNLKELSDKSPTMLVFLRHLGCVFCLETLKEISTLRQSIESTGTRVVLVHMGQPERATAVFDKFDLGDMEQISDPRRMLYRYFGLKRGTFGQLFGPKVFLGAMRAFVKTGRLGGLLQGDGFQMPGMIMVYHGQSREIFRHKTVADRPDYAAAADRSAEVDVRLSES